MARFAYNGGREVEGLYEAGEAKLDSRQHRVERDQARAVSVDVRGHEVGATAAIRDLGKAFAGLFRSERSIRNLKRGENDSFYIIGSDRVST